MIFRGAIRFRIGLVGWVERFGDTFGSACAWRKSFGDGSNGIKTHVEVRAIGQDIKKTCVWNESQPRHLMPDDMIWRSGKFEDEQTHKAPNLQYEYFQKTSHHSDANSTQTKHQKHMQHSENVGLWKPQKCLLGNKLCDHVKSACRLILLLNTVLWSWAIHPSGTEISHQSVNKGNRNLTAKNRPKPKRKGSSSSHPFSEAMLNFLGCSGFFMDATRGFPWGVVCCGCSLRTSKSGAFSAPLKRRRIVAKTHGCHVCKSLRIHQNSWWRVSGLELLISLFLQIQQVGWSRYDLKLVGASHQPLQPTAD